MTAFTDALDRLPRYNFGVYNASTNPYGLSGVGGMDANWEQVNADIARVAQGLATVAGSTIAPLALAWDTGTTDANPGSGAVRANSGTLASVTQLYVSTSDSDGTDVSAILGLIDDSTSVVKGILRVGHRSDSAKWALYTVTGTVVSATGYRKLTVGYVAGSGTLAAADPVALGFVRTGDKGDTGAATWGAGSASAPGLAPSGDANTGLFAPAADTVAIATGGTERVRVASDGTVGLGGPLGSESFRALPAGGGSNNRVAVTAGQDGVSVASLGVQGTSSNGPLMLYSLGPFGYVAVATDGSTIQCVFTHTPSATRYVTVTGSAGGDPTIGSSAGGLKIGVAARGTVVALTDGATITPDMNSGNDFSVTLSGNRTLANPTNLAVGQSGSIFISQDGTGSRTLSYGSYWDFRNGGTAPVLSTAAGKVDRIDYVVRTTTSIHASLDKDYA